MRRSRVLVAYATKRGSTRQVAEAVAATLRERGLHVDLRPAGDVTDVAAYDAVVLGAALYMGRLHCDARRLLKKQRGPLAERPFAVFAIGGVFDPTKLSFPLNRMAASDARDRPAIRAWAAEVAAEFARKAVPA